MEMLRNDSGRSRCPVGASVGKLALLALVVLTVASLASGAPKKDKEQDKGQEFTRIYQHTYDEVFQASLDAIERMGLFVTDKDKDKGTISGDGDYVLGSGTASSPYTFDIHIETLNTKPETRVTINCEWKGHIGFPVDGKLRKTMPPEFEKDLSSEIQKVLATYH